MKERILKILFAMLEVPELTVREQKEMIDSFPEPKDDYDRVFYNYRCSKKGQKLITTVAFNLIGIAACPFLLLLYSINRIVMVFKEKKEFCDAVIIEHTNRVGVKYSIEGRVPQQIFEEFDNVKTLKTGTFPKISKGVIGTTPLKTWVIFVAKHPLKGFLNLRVLINLMGIQRIIDIYEPKAIVISRAEWNGISSLTTYSCERQGVEYINLMHGEMLAENSSAFVRFSRFFIWDEDYIDVLGWSRCERSQFVVFTPEIYTRDETPNKPPRYFLLYALTGNEKTGKDENVELLKQELKLITETGRKCKVRPHPRWSDVKYLEEVFKETSIVLEDINTKTATESILESNYVASNYSTILSEAYYLGKKIVIDDVTNPALIEVLKERKYLMLKKEHILLSELKEACYN